MNEPLSPLALYLIRIPRPRTSVLALLFLIAGLVVSFSISFLVGLGLLIPGAEAAGFPMGVAVTCGLVASCAGPVLWTLAYRLIRKRRALATTPFRDSRLESIVKRPDAMRRAPHRCMEHTARAAHDLRALRKTAGKLPANAVFLLTHRDETPIPSPLPPQERFEPIELLADDPQAEWLLRSAWPPPSEGFDREDPDEVAVYPQRWDPEWFAVPLSFVGLAIGIGYMIHAIITHDRESLTITLVMLGCVALSIIARLVRERRWWVIPGGVIERDVPFWRKVPVLRRTNAGESPLVIDQRFNLAYIVHAQKVRRVPCQGNGQWLLLAAWVNVARRPTDEDLRSYFQAVVK